MSKTNKKKQQYLDSLDNTNIQFENEKSFIRFNFNYYRFENDGCDSFEQWQKDEILADLNNKLKNFSGKSKIELINDKTLEIYTCYPEGSEFEHPKDIQDEYVDWARLRLTGRRRLIGFFRKAKLELDNNVFYIVFLDKNHRFAPSNKRNT